jgi:hypothetical protein
LRHWLIDLPRGSTLGGSLTPHIVTDRKIASAVFVRDRTFREQDVEMATRRYATPTSKGD